MKQAIAMNKGVVITIAIALVAVTAITWKLVDSGKYGYVELNEVYTDCSYAQELMGEYEKNHKSVLQERDSLAKLFKSLVNEKSRFNDSSGVVVYYMKALDERINTIEGMLTEDKDRIDEKVWNYINREISDYGKKKGFKMIFGARGDGGIMYGDESMNVTPAFIDYLNTKPSE